MQFSCSSYLLNDSADTYRTTYSSSIMAGGQVQQLWVLSYVGREEMGGWPVWDAYCMQYLPLQTCALVLGCARTMAGPSGCCMCPVLTPLYYIQHKGPVQQLIICAACIGIGACVHGMRGCHGVYTAQGGWVGGQGCRLHAVLCWTGPLCHLQCWVSPQAIHTVSPRVGMGCVQHTGWTQHCWHFKGG